MCRFIVVQKKLSVLKPIYSMTVRVLLVSNPAIYAHNRVHNYNMKPQYSAAFSRSCHTQHARSSHNVIYPLRNEVTAQSKSYQTPSDSEEPI